MYKNFSYLLLLLCVFIQACTPQEPENVDSSKEQAIQKKTDLHKAAKYNAQLGLGYLKQGDRPRAKKKLLTALKQAPSSADVHAAMAYYFEHTQEIEQAKQHYLKSIALASHGGAQLNNYGAFLCRQGDYKNAEQYFLKAVKDVSYINTSAAYENAGLCSLAIPEYDKARTYFKSALNQDPSRRESLLELIKLEMKTGNQAEAVRQLEKNSNLVLNDPVLLKQAQEIANKVQDSNLVAKYEMAMQNMQSNFITSGVNDEHTNYSG